MSHQVIPNKMIFALDMLGSSTMLWVSSQDDSSSIVTPQFIYICSHSDNLRQSPGQLPVNSRSTPVYLRLIPGRHLDYDRMTSGYHPFISVLFRLNVPVFSGTLRPFGR
ncbi:hypothetical protein K438DRAFT_1982953 [Mycena galopus ATCC 62051]|nr:hypothetical protein K438DRAFT_1982953 [Mycena galopus ATCC 62051]